MLASLIFMNICAKSCLPTQLTIIFIQSQDRYSLYAEIRLSPMSGHWASIQCTLHDATPADLEI
jgi:hypothetical protein